MSERPIRINATCEHCKSTDMQRWESVPGWAECGDCGAEYTLTADGLKPETEPAGGPSDHSERMRERSQMGLCNF